MTPLKSSRKFQQFLLPLEPIPPPLKRPTPRFLIPFTEITNIFFFIRVLEDPGYLVAKDCSPHHLSFPKQILSLLPIFQATLSSNQLLCPHTEFKYFHQIDDFHVTFSFSKALHPPYLDPNTSLYNSHFFLIGFHLHLAKRATLKRKIFFTPNPLFFLL